MTPTEKYETLIPVYQPFSIVPQTFRMMQKNLASFESDFKRISKLLDNGCLHPAERLHSLKNQLLILANLFDGTNPEFWQLVRATLIPDEALTRFDALLGEIFPSRTA